MLIHIEENLNCPGSEQFVFNELDRPRPVKGIVVEMEGKEIVCDVTGVDAGGQWVDAHSLKIADSSEGHAFLIRGGAWGIRLKRSGSGKAWDLDDKGQWGEPFKIYGSEQDILYADP